MNAIITAFAEQGLTLGAILLFAIFFNAKVNQFRDNMRKAIWDLRDDIREEFYKMRDAIREEIHK